MRSLVERDNRLSFQVLSNEDITAEAKPIHLRMSNETGRRQMTESFPGI